MVLNVWKSGIALGLLVIGSTGAWAQRSSPAASAAAISRAETEARDFILRYNRYYAANDVDRYFGSFDPHLTQWWPSGRVDLPTYEKMWRRLVANGGGNSAAVVSDLKVQVSPSADAAVATYILTVTPRKGGKPKAAVERNQETDVLFKRGDVWKIVHVNYGPAAAPKKP